MRGFVFLAGDLGSPLARALVGAANRREGVNPWRRAATLRDAVLYVKGPCPPVAEVDDVADGALIGDLFSHADGGRETHHPRGWIGLAPDQIFRRLSDEAWGRYIAIVRRQGDWAVYRDPSGGLDCFSWRRGGLTVVASGLYPWLEPSLPPDLALDDARLAVHMAAPTGLLGASALRGVAAIAPGQRQWAGATRQVWSPAQVIARGLQPGRDDAARLRRTVVDTIGAWAAQDAPALAEVSGGLDSAIVAAGLCAAPRHDVRAWLNLYMDERLADERAYADAVARHLGLSLIVREKPEARFDPTRQTTAGLALRPPVGAFDQAYDGLIAAEARRLGVTRLISGQGGDTVFLQVPADGLVRDLVRDKGLRGLFSTALIDLARWTRRSVWDLSREALTKSAPRGDLGWRPVAFAGERVHDRPAGESPHPWMDDLEALTPAKRFQIHSLALMQRLTGPSERATVVDCLHPLLSQPIVELCLRTSAIDLTRGGRDRGLVRQAFNDSLPQVIIERRSKGDGTAYFSRMIEASLPVFRDLLLEGELVRRGLLDRAVLETMLTPEYLVWNGLYPEFLDAAVMELWVRDWVAFLVNRAIRPEASSVAG